MRRSMTIIFMVTLYWGLMLLVAESKADNVEKNNNIAFHKKYTFSTKPNYPHCTDLGDDVQLTDGIYTKGYFWTQKSTVGWRTRGEQISITIDLGEDQAICGVAFNTAGGASGVDFLNTILISVSLDGKDFYLVGNLPELSDVSCPSPDNGYKVVKYMTNKLKTHGRYVRFTPLTDGMFCFVDEIEIYQGKSEWRDLTYPENTKIEIDQALFQLRCKKRLAQNIEQLISKVKSANIDNSIRGCIVQNLSSLQKEAENYVPIPTDDFTLIMPFDSMQENVIATHGSLLAAQGFKPLTIWHKERYDPLSIFETPRIEDVNLSLRMMKNEYRAETLNLTNATIQPMEIAFSISNIPGIVDVWQVEYVDTRELKIVATALRPVKKNNGLYTTTIPAGMTRQIWFTIHSKEVTPATYIGQIDLKSNFLNATVPFTLIVENCSFPDSSRLKVGVWDYAINFGYNITKENRARAIKDMREHLVNVTFGSRALMGIPPISGFDAEGNMIDEPDFSEFDSWLELWPGAKVYHIYCGVRNEETTFSGFKPEDKRFQNAVASWARAWDKHITKKNLQPGQVQMHFLDEPKTPKDYQVLGQWVEAFKRGSKRIDVFNTPEALDKNDNMNHARNALKWVDVVCPTFKHYRAYDVAIKKYFQDYIKSRKELWLYMCFGPSRHFDPSYFRLQPWYCYQIGAEGSCFWSYGDQRCKNPWNEYDAYGGESFALVYITPHDITPTKHWEALREGIEDYEYLAILHDKIESLKEKGVKNPLVEQAARVLNSTLYQIVTRVNKVTKNKSDIFWMEPSPCMYAENARLKILDMLIKLNEMN
jgi:hypothetical protein